MSVQSTSMAPRFWIALSRLTTTFRLDMATAPRARLAETTIGSISGVKPTATATAKRKASSQSPLVRPLTANTTGTMTSMKRISRKLTLRTPLSKLVCGRSPTSEPAIEPK